MKLGFQNKKQKVILFVLGVEMLILLVLIGTLFIPEKSYVLSDRENSITLPYGHYFLNCEYSISSDTDYANYLYILNDSGNSDGIQNTVNFLHHEKNEWRTEFWITEPQLNINLVVIEQYKDGPSSFLNYASYEIECTNYIKFKIGRAHV